MNSMRLALISLLFFLSACGGGGNSNSTPPANTPAVNVAPIANAGADQTVPTATAISLDASASSDPDNDNLSYQWRIISAPSQSEAIINNANSVTASFTGDFRGQYQFSVTVSDGQSSATDTVTLTLVSELEQQSGSLSQVLKAIDYGSNQDQRWRQPNSQQQLNFSRAIQAVINQSYLDASDYAARLGYQLIEFTDTDNLANNVHFLLQENPNLSSQQLLAGGTYVFRHDGINAVLQAPHPRSDINTELQAIENYFITNSKVLMLAGTRRDSSLQATQCSGDFFASDTAHNTDTLFFVAHKVLSETDLDKVFVEFHGFGTNSLSNLQTQCNTSSPLLVNLSEGIDYQSDSNEANLRQLFRQEINRAGNINACLFGNQATSLGGTTNVAGRFTNNSPDACTVSATISSRRFLHVEQSFEVRANHRAEMAEHLKQALNKLFQ